MTGRASPAWSRPALATSNTVRGARDLSQRRRVRGLAQLRHRHPRPLSGQQPQDRGAHLAAGTAWSGAVPIGLGNRLDGLEQQHGPCLVEARLAALVRQDGAPDDPQALAGRPDGCAMLTIDGARALLGLDGLIGSHRGGQGAPILVVFDANRLETTPAHDPMANLIYSMGPRSVRDVLVDGEMLVRNGKLTRDDEAVLGAPPSNSRQARRPSDGRRWPPCGGSIGKWCRQARASAAALAADDLTGGRDEARPASGPEDWPKELASE